MWVKVLFTYDYGDERMNRIRELGYEVIYVYEKDVKVDEKNVDAEVLVCYDPFSTLDIKKMKNLKWIQLSSIGIDQVPIDYVKKEKIMITNNKGGYSIPIGEWIVMKILEMFKNSRKFYEKQKNGKWQMDTTLLELYGKTIGFIGTGSIANEGAKRLQGFGVRIIGVNTSGKKVDYFDKCFSMDDLDKMLPECDVVVLTIPYTNKTHNLINNDTISMMKEGVFLVNVSRGSIIDEVALLKFLRNGKIRGAALDVFTQEPLESDHPLWNFNNVIITPHNSWISEKRNERRFNMIYENLKRYISGKKLLNIVDLNKGY
ncbi:dihydrofolate reductase [Crassaminicella thermophila]|uniref:Dihydrofolate reductase n=1 Tax=Crassaminicella thermophila TaxID=2599308 RepID=A0A5C0SH48_CRATE|nr:phosphoglycerate dehydrogenase [Crassaminicella thermophila]QEK13651.1 dihydrofolate reductase [Crassaminicella thermophila]